MEESVENEDNSINKDTKKDSQINNAIRPGCPLSPERACKIPKNVSSDSEMDLHSFSDACNSSEKSLLSKEDSGFAEKLSGSSDDTVQDSNMEDVDSSPQVESDINVSQNSSQMNDSEGSSEPLFTRTHKALKQRNYRKRSFANLDDSSNDGENIASTSSENGVTVETQEEQNNTTENESSAYEESPLEYDYDSDSSSSDSNDDLETLCYSDEEGEGEATETPLVLLKPKPKHNWNALSEVINRPFGLTKSTPSDKRLKRAWGTKQFEQRYYRSLHAVQRLELMYKLQEHEGCVNSLCFNKSGNLLASGSDDLYINIWAWSLGKKLMSFKSEHRSNVFQSKFLPFEGDLHIASSARDGQVRLSILSPSGELVSSRRLCQHRGMVHKISLVCDQPHTILSAGDDAVVISSDLRESRPKMIVKVQEDSHRVPLYSIHCHPLLGHEFVLGGKDQFVRIYDLRNPKEPAAKFKPLSEAKRLDGANRANVHITSAIYNYNGREILASYTDDDIYLFSNDPTDTEKDKSKTSRDGERDYIGHYAGHRNQATIKGANFFGPCSEYVLSGSDCSYCYIWDKKTESIVQWFRGDENGVVNCMEPHPHIPVLATSGLDYDVKIWVPSKEEPTSLDNLNNVVRVNKRRSASTDHYQEGVSDWIDGQMLWMFLNRAVWNENSGETNDEDTTHSDSSEDEIPSRGGGMSCSPS